MKKKVLFCLAALGTASMLFGFDSAETAESILEKTQTAVMENASGADTDMDINMDVSLDISDSTTSSSIGIGASGNFDLAMNMEPAALSMDGKFDMSIFGQSQSMTMKMYGVTSEDGTFDTYVYSEDSASGEEGSWIHQSSDLAGLNMEDFMEQTADVDFSEWGLDFELASDPVTVDGTECYLLTAVMDSSSFETILEKAAEMSDQNDLSDENTEMVMSMLDGLKIKFEYYVDTASYFPVKFHMDLNDSDLSAISQYLAMSMGEMAEGSSIELVLNDISVDASMAYGDAKEIIVPEEALAAPESTSEDVVEEVENALGGITG